MDSLLVEAMARRGWVMDDYETFDVSFEVSTNLSEEALKAAVLSVIERGDLELENRLEDEADIDVSTVTVFRHRRR